MTGSAVAAAAAGAAGAGLAERSSFAFLFHLAKFGAALRLTIKLPFFSLAAAPKMGQLLHSATQKKSENVPSSGMAATGGAGAGVETPFTVVEI